MARPQRPLLGLLMDKLGGSVDGTSKPRGGETIRTCLTSPGHASKSVEKFDALPMGV